MPKIEALVGWSVKKGKYFHRMRWVGSYYQAFCSDTITLGLFGHPKDSGREPCKKCYGKYAK